MLITVQPDPNWQLSLAQLSPRLFYYFACGWTKMKFIASHLQFELNSKAGLGNMKKIAKPNALKAL